MNNFNIIDVPRCKSCHHIYSNNSTTIEYNNTQTWGKPPM